MASVPDAENLTMDTMHMSPPLDADRPRVVGDGIFLPSLDIEVAERTLIREALVRAGGNRSVAASLLGMNLRTLQRRLASNPTLLKGFRTRLAPPNGRPD